MTGTGIGIIIQARMGSTRLPRKVLAAIDGVPMLEFLIRRLEQVQYADKIAVATTESPEDIPISDLCDLLRIPCYVGSEEDVLARYIACASSNNIDVIIRICADCPLTDPRSVDELILAYKKTEPDHITNKILSGYPDGMGAELATLEALEHCNAIASASDDSAHEHVMLYIRNHPESFKVVKLDAPQSRRDTSIHVAVDYPQDLELVRELCQRFPRPVEMNTGDVLKLFRENPQLLTLNAGLHKPYAD